ncbi:MAG: FMN-binding protein [Candidatus Mcinerneyibacterium aminivorans]|jgi:Na+-transporting NADH:ubiquinone oxidoreductase subunit C|uniref:FMN-binding protein n=1 Tax=Candidatus Mcinerneyibacterium aminivorans TaxID=2703815 RepID=A0A5D0MGA1_9BACT|nr:MAG: FMN-binding protein [Candidatus Mcinerneyibacterium aminivorans]
MGKNKDKLKDGLYTVSFMFVVTSIFILITSFIYIKTKDKIKTNEKLRLQKAVLRAGGLNINEDNKEDIQKKFDKIKLIKENVYFIENLKSEGVYIFIVTGSGLWGKIRAAIGLKKDLKTITGLEFLKQNETPGLGARIEENWFKTQFSGKVGPFTGVVGEEKKAEKSEFQAITGATKTSTAVLDIINNTINNADKYLKGEK